MMEPTETSRFRVMRTTACAAATMARMAALEMIALRFPGAINCGRSSVNATPSKRRKAATPLTRNLSANWPKPFRASPSVDASPPSVSIRAVPRVPCGGDHHGLLIDRARIHFRDKLAFSDNEDAVRNAKHFRQVGRDDQNGQSLVGELSDDAVNLRLRADVHAVRRLIEDENLWPRGEPAGESHLLPVAAGQIRDQLVDARCADLVCLTASEAIVRPAASSMKPSFASRARMGSVTLSAIDAEMMRPNPSRSSGR